MKKVLAVILCLVMSCVFVCACADGFKQEYEDLYQRMGKNKGPVGVNTPMETKDGIVYTVRGYKESGGQGDWRPTKGNTFIYILIDIENKSDNTFTFDSMFDQNNASVDREDAYWSMNAELVAGLMKLESLQYVKISPKQKVSGYFALEVPQNWANIRLRFCDADINGFYLFDVYKADFLDNKTSGNGNDNKQGNTSSVSQQNSSTAESIKTDLSPSNKCPVRPSIYCAPRYMDTAKRKAINIDKKKGLSAKQINNEVGSKEYGLYFKFTPGGKDDGYRISRFDVVISNSKGGKILYTEGFDSDMVCQKNYYWYWEFFSLQGLFDKMQQMYGEVIPGSYTMDIYFNRLWAGKTVFQINK